MTTPRNPFLRDSPIPGSGEVHLSLLPPGIPSFSTLTYTYPLKLVPSAPHIFEDGTIPSEALDHARTGGRESRPKLVPLLFMLSYGGGLLPPDAINLKIRLDQGTRLVIATQGSTKIFPSEPFQQPRGTQSNQAQTPKLNPASQPGPRQDIDRAGLPTAIQTLNVHLAAHSALCLTPDPTQPFQGSKYVQRQIFTVHPDASLLLLDWTTEGRRARGESWDADLWRGCNEIWREVPGSCKDERPSKTRLQLRDHVILECDGDGPLAGDHKHGNVSGHGMRALREQGMGCFGTLVALGEVVRDVGEFFIREFESLPRIGGRDWGDEEKTEAAVEEEHEAKLRKSREAWRKNRLKLEREQEVLWTAARVRGLVLVKFSAREVHGARKWLAEMLAFEGTIAREFGDGGLICVK